VLLRQVIEWYAVPPGGFASCSAWHFELTDKTRAYVIKRAHDSDGCLIEGHSHDDPDPPALSASDLFGFREFVPHVWWRLHGRPYTALVVSQGGLDGFVWRRGPDDRSGSWASRPKEAWFGLLICLPCGGRVIWRSIRMSDRFARHMPPVLPASSKQTARFCRC
jgi:hypothetical protein